MLLADGTGNAFTTQESSVWRLYEALDHIKPDQIAYYIKGVGTAGCRRTSTIAGMTWESSEEASQAGSATPMTLPPAGRIRMP